MSESSLNCHVGDKYPPEETLSAKNARYLGRKARQIFPSRPAQVVENKEVTAANWKDWREFEKGMFGFSYIPKDTENKRLSKVGNKEATLAREGARSEPLQEDEFELYYPLYEDMIDPEKLGR
jgi:hypothetical protein